MVTGQPGTTLSGQRKTYPQIGTKKMDELEIQATMEKDVASPRQVLHHTNTVR